MRCMSFYNIMSLWYGWIASWDIRALVFFAQKYVPLSLTRSVITLLGTLPMIDT